MEGMRGRRPTSEMLEGRSEGFAHVANVWRPLIEGLARAAGERADGVGPGMNLRV